MLNIIKVQPTVGDAVVFAVSSNDANFNNLHNLFMAYVEREYGELSTVTYIEQYAVAVVHTMRLYNINAFMNLDDLVTFGM